MASRCSNPQRRAALAMDSRAPHAFIASANTMDCCICAELRSQQFPKDYSGAYGVDARICYETADLVVVPSVSPVSAGHVLILPRAHVTRLADLPKALLEQLSDCVRYVEQRLCARFGSSLYSIEHGVTVGQVACGIDHAHLHVISLRGDIIAAVEREVEDQFPQDSEGTLPEVLTIAASRQESYLLHGPSAGVVRIAFSEQIPSQYMRRLIAKASTQSDWDWKRLYGRLEFLATRDAFDRA